MNKRQILRLIIFLSGMWLLATGWTDLDWMLVENHFQMWNAAKDTWEFCPYLTLNWWVAFELTLAKIVVGALITGWFLRDIYIGHSKTVAFVFNQKPQPQK